jgi:hypothetical protein
MSAQRSLSNIGARARLLSLSISVIGPNHPTCASYQARACMGLPPCRQPAKGWTANGLCDQCLCYFCYQLGTCYCSNMQTIDALILFVLGFHFSFFILQFSRFSKHVHGSHSSPITPLVLRLLLGATATLPVAANVRLGENPFALVHASTGPVLSMDADSGFAPSNLARDLASCHGR